MKLAQTIAHTIKNTVQLAVVLLLVICLSGSMQICLCDNDPDNCGQECHECNHENHSECEHITIDVDDTINPSTEVSVALAAIIPYFLDTSCDITHSYALLERPTIDAVDDYGGNLYIYSAKRLYPLS